MKSCLFLLVIAGMVAGCSIDYVPDVGPIQATGPGSTGDGGTTGGCDNADSDPMVAVSFSADIGPLWFRSPGGCNCHLGRATAGLDLSSYESILRGGVNSGTEIIVAGKPCESILVQKLGRTPPFGSRMPFNGPPYPSAEEQQLVHDWIAEGALNN